MSKRQSRRQAGGNVGSKAGSQAGELDIDEAHVWATMQADKQPIKQSDNTPIIIIKNTHKPKPKRTAKRRNGERQH
ncbi:hypothetical protein N9L68_06805 [bacterium]|nr:hypothetical protein [bacterium]